MYTKQLPSLSDHLAFKCCNSILQTQTKARFREIGKFTSDPSFEPAAAWSQ